MSFLILYHTQYILNILLGDEGDKMFFILSGELDVYIINTELEDKSSKQRVNTDEQNQNDLSKSSGYNSNLSQRRTKSPVRSKDALSGRESSQQSLLTEEDASPASGRILITLGESERSKEDQKNAAITLHVAKKFTKKRPSSGSNQMRRRDIRDLSQTGKAEIYRGSNGQLLDNGSPLKYLNTLKSGAVFGEMALTTGRRRAATIIAVDEVHLGILRRDDFNRILQAIERKALEKELDFLAKALRINISSESLTKLSRMFQEERMKFKQVIFEEGDVAEGFYIVKSGEIVV